MKYIALILSILVFAANNKSCAGGGGISWTLDGQPHSFAWWSGPLSKVEGKP